MASLSGVLAGIPGLRGWQGQDQYRQEQMQGDQANQMNQMKLAQIFEAQQKQQKLNEILQQSGGDPQKAAQAALSAGFTDEAAKIQGMIPKAGSPEKTPDFAQLIQIRDSYAAKGDTKNAELIDAHLNKLNSSGGDGRPMAVEVNGQPTLVSPKDAIGKKPYFKPGLSSINADLLTPEAIDVAAERFRVTGTLPPMGMGGAVAKSKILNKAAELAQASGDTGQAAAYRQMQGKADQQALGQLEKQATMVGAFEKTANSNLQLAVSLSDKVSRAGVPVFDKWIQSGRKSIAGDPDVAKFHAANETFINEYAKIMSGSMGNTAISDAARANAHEVLSNAFTKEQYREVTNTLKTEMQNRIKGFNDQRDEVKTRLTGGATTSQPTVVAPTPAQETKVINGKTYIKINGQWHE